jgi:hypothetical protein
MLPMTGKATNTPIASGWTKNFRCYQFRARHVPLSGRRSLAATDKLY